jgi:hypothetical protein
MEEDEEENEDEEEDDEEDAGLCCFTPLPEARLLSLSRSRSLSRGACARAVAPDADVACSVDGPARRFGGGG